MKRRTKETTLQLLQRMNVPEVATSNRVSVLRKTMHPKLSASFNDSGKSLDWGIVFTPKNQLENEGPLRVLDHPDASPHPCENDALVKGFSAVIECLSGSPGETQLQQLSIDSYRRHQDGALYTVLETLAMCRTRGSERAVCSDAEQMVRAPSSIGIRLGASVPTSTSSSLVLQCIHGLLQSHQESFKTLLRC